MIDAVTKRWIRTKADETAAAAGCRFRPERAERVRSFFRKFLRHSKGEWAGQPFELLDWQYDDVFAPLFGWVGPDDTDDRRVRRFRTAYIEIPKKNGKSTMAAGVGLYMLVADAEPGAEVYSSAVTKEQASIVHDEAINMVKKSKGLSSYLKINASTREIRFPKTSSIYRALASGGDAQEGKNFHCLITDELHAWKGVAGRSFYESLEFGGAARLQPLHFNITTAGDDQLTICYEKREYAIDIAKGRIRDDISFFGYVRAADPKDDLDDPAVWAKANPSLGVTIKADRFAEELARAKAKPAAWSSFKRYRLNLWTAGGDPAFSEDGWDACAADFAESDLVGRDCWGGLDLSRTRDMTAFALVFLGDTPGEYLLLVWNWLPRARLDDEATPAQFREWAEHGHLRVTEGNVTDYTVVEEFIVDDLAKRFRILELAFDPYFAEEITQRISERTGIKRIEFAQTMANFAAPTAEFERLVIGCKMKHSGNPLLRWQAGNVAFKTDANNNKRPVKPKDIKKIDGVVAAIQALARAMAWKGGEEGCAI